MLPINIDSLSLHTYQVVRFCVNLLPPAGLNVLGVALNGESKENDPRFFGIVIFLDVLRVFVAVKSNPRLLRVLCGTLVWMQVLDITLNGISIESDPTVYQKGKGIIVDSGTTDTYLPKSVAKGFSKAWESVTGSVRKKRGFQS